MTEITHEALEALSKKATDARKAYDAHPDHDTLCALLEHEKRFGYALADLYRTGQLIHAVPSETLSPDAIRDCLVTTVLATTAQPSGDEVEAVARATAPFMEGGREYDQMPATRRELKIWSRNGMALINDATQDDAQEAATAAITALDAVRGKQ